MNTVPRTETPALIIAMEHLAKTISKNGGIAAVTIQEGADRLRELEARAECERLKELLRIESASAQHALAWAERAEAEVKRLKGMRTAAEAIMTDVAEANEELAIARAEKAEAEVERLLRYDAERQIACESYFARAERAEAESLEQARLLGMSASREASLLGKISRLEHQLEK